MLDLTRERVARDQVADRVRAADRRRVARGDAPSGEARIADLVRAAARGEAGAWDMLVHRLTPAIRRAARMYRLSPHEVDDVVQACWLALFLNVHRIREPEAVRAWLVTAARRQALGIRQREVRELLTDEPVPSHCAAADATEQAVFDAERAMVLHGAIARLPGRQRTLLETLVASPDRSYAEVSETLGMPIGSIGPTRERGLDRLRRDERLARVVAG
jgi:RNA polymerase sigma factor (sigma-70 family)